MSTPYQAMKATYRRFPEPYPLIGYVEWHLNHGFIFSTPHFFIQGFVVNKDKLGSGAYPVDCYDPKGDCWYVSDMAGDIGKAWSILPWELPFIAWHRDRHGGKDLHIVPLSRMRSLSSPTTP